MLTTGNQGALLGPDLCPFCCWDQPPWASSGLFSLLKIKAFSQQIQNQFECLWSYANYCFYYVQVCLPNWTLKSGSCRWYLWPLCSLQGWWFDQKPLKTIFVLMIKHNVLFCLLSDLGSKTHQRAVILIRCCYTYKADTWWWGMREYVEKINGNRSTLQVLE